MSVSPPSSSSSATDETAATSVDVPVLSETEQGFSTSERVNAALAQKEKGNKHFVQGQFIEAKECYSHAIALDPTKAVYWSNRAACDLKLEQQGLAITDATQALSLDPGFAKAYYRRASAYLAILDPKSALPDLRTVLKIEPSNTTVRSQLDATSKLVRRLEFEKAIRVEEAVPSSVTIEEHLEQRTGGTELRPDYDGPRLPTDGQNGVPDKPWLGTINATFIEEMIAYFKEGKRLPIGIAWPIVLGALRTFKNEPTLVRCTVPQGHSVHVVGDTHGQFYDFLHLMNQIGAPTETHTVLFNGDFVDRGSWSVEIALTIMAYKWLYPHTTLVNRGNHETSDMNKVYGFEGECKAKFGGENTFKLFTELFVAIPLATLISAPLPPIPSEQLPADASKSLAQTAPITDPKTGCKRFFVVHGGLFSRDNVSLDEINAVDRFAKKQPGQEGLMMELLWSDPQPMAGRGPSKRGVGLGFGPDITRAWCEYNHVAAVLRSHEVRQNGYAEEHQGLCCTVFSAPNYCDSTGNLGAFARIDDRGTLFWTTFEAQPHPSTSIRMLTNRHTPDGIRWRSDERPTCLSCSRLQKPLHTKRNSNFQV